MNRDILFRGFHPCDKGFTVIIVDGKKVRGKWVCGYLFKIWDETFILWGTTNNVPNMIQVLPSTVSQYTGLTDKNGKKIFEGDLFTPPDVEIDKAVAEFAHGAFRVTLYGTLGAMMESGWDETAGGYGIVESEPIENYGVNEFEIIGTIWDKEA